MIDVSGIFVIEAPDPLNVVDRVTPITSKEQPILGIDVPMPTLLPLMCIELDDVDFIHGNPTIDVSGMFVIEAPDPLNVVDRVTPITSNEQPIVGIDVPMPTLLPLMCIELEDVDLVHGNPTIDVSGMFVIKAPDPLNVVDCVIPTTSRAHVALGLVVPMPTLLPLMCIELEDVDLVHGNPTIDVSGMFVIKDPDPLNVVDRVTPITSNEQPILGIDVPMPTLLPLM